MNNAIEAIDRNAENAMPKNRASMNL